MATLKRLKKPNFLFSGSAWSILFVFSALFDILTYDQGYWLSAYTRHPPFSCILVLHLTLPLPPRHACPLTLLTAWQTLSLSVWVKRFNSVRCEQTENNKLCLFFHKTIVSRAKYSRSWDFYQINVFTVINKKFSLEIYFYLLLFGFSAKRRTRQANWNNKGNQSVIKHKRLECRKIWPNRNNEHRTA